MGIIRTSDLPDPSVKRKLQEQKLLNSKPGKRLWESLPAGCYKGRRAFIVGGGTSLRGFDFSQLKGEIVFAINRAFEYTPFAVSMLAQDARLWPWYEIKNIPEYLGDEARNKWLDFRGFKTWINCQSFPYPEDIHIIDVIGDANPIWDPTRYDQGLPMVSNCGANALHLLTVLGANPIYLLGFDMYGEGGRTANFHGGYSDNNNDTVYPDFTECFRKYADIVKSRTRVINLNPKSNLKCYELGRFEDIKKINRPVIVTFWTPEYEPEIKRLEASVRKFGFEYDFVKIEKRGDWKRTVYWRADFVKSMLEKHKRDVVWVDADAEFVQYPALFDNFVDDFAAHIAEWKDRPRELLGGTMYFKFTERTLQFVNRWIEMNSKFPNEPLSQIIIQKTLDSMIGTNGPFTMINLPASYCQIFDLMADKGDPIVQHYQASRKYRDA